MFGEKRIKTFPLAVSGELVDNEAYGCYLVGTHL